jgi:hypothetical protein
MTWDESNGGVPKSDRRQEKLASSEEGATPLSGRHRPSHLDLLAWVPEYGTSARVPRVNLDAVVVPTSRAYQDLGGGIGLAAEIAARTDAQLVILRSGPASREPFPRDLAPRSSHPTVVVDLPEDPECLLPEWQSGRHVVAKMHGRSDLGVKRNLAILMGQRCGWDAVLMLDDDISTRRASRLPPHPGSKGAHPSLRLDDVLADFHEYPQVRAAGYIQQDFDDHSVVCHARQLSGWPQAGFISGGALVVRCTGRLPFFPQTYNEDWLFFYALMLQGRHVRPSATLKLAGVVHQRAYYPYSAQRAQSEELGDVLAEGLFGLLALPPDEVVSTARRADYWKWVVWQRQTMILDLLQQQRRRYAHTDHAVLVDVDEALRAALAVYAGSTDWGVTLAEYIRQLLDDLDMWDELRSSQQAKPVRLDQALADLGLGGNATWVQGRGRWAPLPDQRVAEVS